MDRHYEADSNVNEIRFNVYNSERRAGFYELARSGKRSAGGAIHKKCNASGISSGCVLSVSRSSLYFFAASLLLAAVLIFAAFYKLAAEPQSGWFISLACGIIAAVFASFFTERSANKRIFAMQAEGINSCFCDIYTASRFLADYVLPSENMTDAYALKLCLPRLKSEKSLSEEIEKTASEIRESVSTSDLPCDEKLSQAYVRGFELRLNTIISRADALTLNYGRYLTQGQKDRVLSVSKAAGEFLTVVQGYSRERFRVRADRLDEVVLWARKTATQEFVNDTYVQL